MVGLYITVTFAEGQMYSGQTTMKEYASQRLSSGIGTLKRPEHPNSGDGIQTRGIRQIIRSSKEISRMGGQG
jgi:hypothetical protein